MDFKALLDMWPNSQFIETINSYIYFEVLFIKCRRGLVAEQLLLDLKGPGSNPGQGTF